MIEMIKQKIHELNAAVPESAEFRKWIDDSNQWYWLYADMNRQGIRVGKRQVVDVLMGALLEDTPMTVYGFIHGFSGIYKDMKNYVLMKNSLTRHMMDQWYLELFTPGTNADPMTGHRISTSVVYEWGYIPPHFHEINVMLDDLFLKHAKERFSGNVIQRAESLYLGILRIYPYGEQTPTMAGLAFIYTLMEEHLPIPSFLANEQEYNTMVASYLEKDDKQPLVHFIEKSIYNRLDAILQVALARAEQEKELLWNKSEITY